MYGYDSNNVYQGAPPLMQDGRSIISSWNTESEINKVLKENNGIQNNWEYRKFLTRNGLNIMDLNRKETANDTGNMYKRFPNSVSYEPRQPQSHSPYLYKSGTDKSTPSGFTTSDLKEKYLTREQLNARITIPSIAIQKLEPMKTVNDYQ